MRTTEAKVCVTDHAQHTLQAEQYVPFELRLPSLAFVGFVRQSKEILS